MFAVKEYLRGRAVRYAQAWAFDRNPLFYNFTGQGGDCTSFISQCLLSGGCVMNFTPDFGWYYSSPNDRAAAWSGVPFFWRFMTENYAVGPFGISVGAGDLEAGDVIQLGNAEGVFYHSLLVTGFQDGTYLVAAHSDDSFNRPLNTYTYQIARFLHISGFRIQLPDDKSCFENLLSGEILPQSNGVYLPISQA